MTKFKIESLTEELMIKYYGEDIGYKAEGLALTLDGEPMAIAGVAFDDDKALAFEEHKFNPREYALEVYKFSFKVMDIIKKYPAYAIPGKSIHNAGKFLKKLGFIEISEGIYQCQAS